MHSPFSPARVLAAVALFPVVLAVSVARLEAQDASPPPSAVSVIIAAPEELPIINELPGRIAPTRIAEASRVA